MDVKEEGNESKHVWGACSSDNLGNEQLRSQIYSGGGIHSQRDDITTDPIEFAAAGNSFYGQACGEVDERLFQNTLGLPSGFSVGHVEKQIKGNKQTCYCDICLVELSSLDTMRNHVAGVKRQKKEMTVKRTRRIKCLGAK